MTLSTFNLYPNYSTDLLWRTDCVAIDAAILAAGMVATSDTGQIDLSTAAKPTVGSTAAGYKMYRFSDAYQASYPCFIKVEYGIGGQVTYMGVWVTVGTQTDGAGNLTGNIVSSRVPFYNATTATGPNLSGASGSTSRLTLTMSATSSANPGYFAQWFSVERLQSTAGADTTTGLVIVWASRSTGPTSGNQVLYYAGSQPPANNTICTLMANQPAGTTWTIGADTGTGPILPIGWGIHPCIQGGLSYFNADLSAAGTYSVSLYGVTRTFYAVGSAGIGAIPTLNAAASILVRWD